MVVVSDPSCPPKASSKITQAVDPLFSRQGIVSDDDGCAWLQAQDNWTVLKSAMDQTSSKASGLVLLWSFKWLFFGY